MSKSTRGHVCLVEVGAASELTVTCIISGAICRFVATAANLFLRSRNGFASSILQQGVGCEWCGAMVAYPHVVLCNLATVHAMCNWSLYTGTQRSQSSGGRSRRTI